jgi:glycosyltransferase involved in cell wall biosynthesis
MNVLQITAWDNLGQQFNGYQIHQELQRLGHYSQMLVNHKGFADTNIYEVGNTFTRKIDRYLRAIEKRLSLYALLPISSYGIYYTQYFQKVDIIHLQLIHAESFFSLLNLPIISTKKKVIWTLHDPWLLSGHCVHSLDCDRWLTGCGDCPDLNLSIPVKRDTTALMWKFKHWIMHHADITLVVASEWMYQRVKQSPIVSHLPCHIIPLGLDTKVFKPLDKYKCREKLAIPMDAQVLGFRYQTTAESFKGWPWLEQALVELEIEKPTYLLVFEGQGGMERLRDKYQIIELGWVHDQQHLAVIMGAMDIFLMPSIAESFGMMAVEAMACGTPVIAFENTALCDVIQAPKSGVAVRYQDAQALREAIANLLNDQGLRSQLAQAAVQLVKSEYETQTYLARHINLYENLLG